MSRLEKEASQVADEEVTQADLRLVIGKLEEFTEQLEQGLEGADWQTRREIIRALVKHIEITDQEIRVVYRVNVAPFVNPSKGGIAQDCWKVQARLLLHVFPRSLGK